MPTFALVQVPYFSLYGDGTVIYRSASAPFPEQKPGEPMRFPPLRVATMTEEQVQALLRDALGDGGLGVAGPRYENLQVADAPTAVFTVNADGRQRRVSAYALGMASPTRRTRTRTRRSSPRWPPSPSACATSTRRSRRGTGSPRASTSRTASGRPSSRAASSMASRGPGRGRRSGRKGSRGRRRNGSGFPSRAISGLEVSLLGIEEPEGGVSGISLRAPNGTVYVLGIRPLLPDEQR